MLSFKLNKNTPITVLCLGAHCDDIEIGAGGALLKIFNEYKISQVNWVVFTSNEVRKKEALKSASKFVDKIDNTHISIKSFDDGFLPYNAKEVKKEFENLKTQIEPDIIFTHYRNDRHQDHRLVSDLTWNTWRNHLILEYEIPKYDGDLGQPQFYIPLTKNILSKRNKILLESYETQLSKHWFSAETFNAMARIRGTECASIYAEAFYARKIVL